MSDYVELRLLEGTYAIAKLPPGSRLPDLPVGAKLWSITVTSEEVSLVCDEEHLPGDQDLSVERRWCCLRVEGPLEFELKGVLAGMLVPLAAAGVSVVALSTYSTDYILVKESHLARATAALGEAGHVVR
jgi:hypothetical protein